MLYQSPSQNIHSTTGHSSYNNSVQEPTCLLTFATRGVGPLQSSKMFLSWPAEVTVGTALAFHTAGGMEEGTWCAIPPGVAG